MKETLIEVKRGDRPWLSVEAAAAKTLFCDREQVCEFTIRLYRQQSVKTSELSCFARAALFADEIPTLRLAESERGAKI